MNGKYDVLEELSDFLGGMFHQDMDSSFSKQSGFTIAIIKMGFLRIIHFVMIGKNKSLKIYSIYF